MTSDKSALQEASTELVTQLEPLYNIAGVMLLLLMAYLLLYRSALVFLWFMPLSPILHRLGFRVVTWDRSFHIYVIRWRRDWMGVHR